MAFEQPKRGRLDCQVAQALQQIGEAQRPKRRLIQKVKGSFAHSRGVVTQQSANGRFLSKRKKSHDAGVLLERVLSYRQSGDQGGNLFARSVTGQSFGGSTPDRRLGGLQKASQFRRVSLVRPKRV